MTTTDGVVRADLHVHSLYSMDCSTPLERIVQQCLKKGINCVAIADHGTAEGGLRLQALAPFRVIPGEEILTPEGEVMGLFLKETVPSGLSAEEAIARVKAQGGLVCIPHPFARFGRCGFDFPALERLLPRIDIIEGFNSRTWPRKDSDMAMAFARGHKLPVSAGSDAHTWKEIGRAYVEMPGFDGPAGFLEALARGKVVGRTTGLWIHYHSVLVRLRRLLRGRPASKA